MAYFVDRFPVLLHRLFGLGLPQLQGLCRSADIAGRLFADRLQIIGRTAQDFGDRALGPILIVVGVIMLIADRISLGLGGGRLSALGAKVAGWGMLGGFLLGVLFALAFCPYSAALFFGVLIPLSLKSAGGVALPAVYAIGTGLPVLVFGVLISLSVARVSAWLNAVTRAERIIRVAASIIFIGVGIYLVVIWIQS